MDVFYGSQKRQQLDGMTLISVDTHLVRIRATENYKSPDEWHRLSLDQAPLYFTLGKGDVIVKGEVDDSIPDNAPRVASSANTRMRLK